MVDVTKDVSPTELATKAGSVKLVSSLTALLKLPGLTRLSSDVRRDERRGITYPVVLDESAKAMTLGVLVGTVAGMVMVADPREVAEVKGAEKVKTPPSLGSVCEGVAVGVVSVLLLRTSATGELAIVTVGDIDVASVTSLVETDRSTGTPGDVVGGSTEFPSVVVKPLVEELVGVGALSRSGVEVVVAVMFKVAVVWA